jgi:hypothetical protein
VFNPMFCPPPPATHPDGINVADVSFGGVNSTGCYGVAQGTANSTNIGFEGFAPLLVGALPGGPAATGTLDGIDFTLAASGPDIGTWSLGWSGGQGPITLDVVAVVETNLLSFSSYFFDDLVLAVSPGSGNGEWVINYLISEDVPILSAFSIYARDFRGPGGGETPPPPPTPVDEPATGGLLALAAVGLALTRRRSIRA